jgi:hypothetical protein
MKYIYHHLGFGDHIVCNGMVRYFYKKYNELSLFCYIHNLENVLYMYRDLDNLNVIGIDSDQSAVQYILDNKLDTIQVGFSKLKNLMPEIACDKAFYKSIGLDFSIRFDEFYFERNYEQENQVLKNLNPSNEKYIFVHDDPSRGFDLDLNKVNSQYKIIKNDEQFKIFDYLTLLENAEEIHFMQSSFKELICSYKMEKPKLYQHNYIRKYTPELNTSGLNPIIEIN